MHVYKKRKVLLLMDYMYEYYDKILSCYVLSVTRRNNVKLRYLLV